MSEYRCPHPDCNYWNPSKARYCGGCGKPLPHSRHDLALLFAGIVLMVLFAGMFGVCNG